MADLNAMFAEATSGERPSILGVVAVAVNSDGNTIVASTAGKTNLDSAVAKAMDKDSVFALASCTKIITAIAALRLVEHGQISLDDASVVAKHIPELCQQNVITSTPGQPLTFEERKKPITVRQLLTHTSGSGADILDPRLIAWRKARGEPPMHLSAALPDAIALPNLFQPGEGWAYGGGSDWVGLLISRISGEGLDEWMRKEIFDVVGCDERIGFSKKKIEETGEKVVQVVTTTKAGELREHHVPEQKSERGGGGLYSSANNFAKILADLVSPSPKILSPKTLDILFAPQLDEGSIALTTFHSQSSMFMTGPLTTSLSLSAVNHALGGLLVTKDNPALGKSKGTMSWGGAFGSLWFVNREQGVGAFYGGSMFPPGDAKSGELMGAFIREVWGKVG
ncbi:beta-lactamase/transpeptidase-like protein [Pyrenochaeta sp. MPI-SDFR-AT-0127]|nr:beta-lactamase/transpeptidase-like protein [Pyrenochaeta sp. MPI-SDFR-AT-0127]